MKTKSTSSRLTSALILLVSVASLHAQTQNWVGGISTDWNEGINWNVNGVPGFGNSVIINTNSGNQPALFSGSNASLGSGDVTVGSNASSGGNTTLTIQSGMGLTNTNGTIGNSGGSAGHVYVTTSGNWTNTGSLTIGGFGSGTLTVNTGGTASSASATLGFNSSGVGIAVVDGSGSHWSAGSNLLVGSLGDGTLQISNGGSVSSTQSTFGSAPAGHGAVAVSGANSILATGGLTVASSGTGSLEVSDGGLVTGGLLRVGLTSGSNGVVTISNGTVTMTTANVGLGGTGALTISGGGNLNAPNAGGLTLGTESGSNGTLNIGDYSGGTTSGTLNAPSVEFGSGTGIINFNQTDSVTFSANITGNGTVNQRGNGTTALTGTNTYNGTTFISGGILQIGAGGTSGTLGSGGVLNGGILAFNRSDAYSVSNSVSGSGSVQQTGSGTTILSGNNSYSGGTSLNAGTVQIASDSNLGDTAGQLTFDGGSLAVTSGVTLARGVSVDAGGGTLAQGAIAVQINGAFGGSGNLSKTGAGTLTFNGSGTNSANGTLTVEAGTVNAAAVNVFGSDQKVFLFQGTTLDLAGHNQTVGGLIGNGNAVLGNGNLTLNLSDDRAFSGVISGNGTVIKTGAGTQQVLNESSSYSGGTQILGGTVVVPSDSALGSAAGGLTLDSGTLKLASSSSSFTTGRSIALGNSGGTVDTTGRTATLNGGISGNGALTKSGAGTLVLAGSNSYAGGTTVNQGTLAVSSDARLGSGGSTLNGGVLSVSSTTSSARDFVLAGGSLSQDQYVTHTISGNVSGAGALKKEGAGTLTLSGNNTYAGGTQINQGVLSVATNANLGDAAGAVTLGNATLQSTGTFSTERGLILTSSFSPILTVASSFSSVSVSSGQVVTWNGTVGGFGTLNKTGAGELVLNGDNMHAGTYINQGILTISSQENLGSVHYSPVTFNNGTLKTSAAISLERGLAGSTGRVDTGGFDSTFSGAVSLYSFTKAGNGTLTRSNSSSSTVLIVEAGTLRAAEAGALNTNSFGTVSVSGGATYDLNGFNTSIGALFGSGAVTLGNATLRLNNSGSFGGTISGNGSLIQNGSGYQTLSGANSYTGGTTVNFGGLIFDQASSLPAAGQITVKAGGYAGAGFAMNQAFLDKFNKAGSAGVIGFNASSSNTLDLTGFNASATLGTSNSVANFSGSLTPQGSAFRFGGGNGQLTVSGNLTGSRSLSNTGALTLLLSGTNSYTGGTSAANSAVVIFSGASAIPASGSLTAASGGYIGNSFAVDQTFLDKFDKANSAGIIGVNMDTISALNLTGFHAGASLGTTGTASINGAITPQGNQYRFAGGNGYLTVADTLSGNRSVLVSNLSVTLSGDNSYSGGTQIASGGSLTVWSDSNLGNASGGLTLGGWLTTSSSFSMSRAIVADGGTINVQNGFGSTELHLNGPISGSGFTKWGAGTLVLGTSNSFNALSINEGQVSLGAAGALPSGLSLSLDNFGSGLNMNGFSQSVSVINTGFGTSINLGSAALTVDSESSNGIYGTISGTGSLVKSGNGTLSLSSGNTYGGGTTLNAGTLSLFGDTAIGSGGLAFNGGSLYTAGSFTANQSIAFSGAAAKSIEVTDFDPSDDFDTVVSLSGSLSGSGNFTKSGAGVLQLSGASSHSGSITVADGELKVSGTTASTVIASSSDTVVSGTGSVFSLLISDGATLAPGNSPGTLTTASATFGADGSYDWEIQSNSLYDTLNVTTSLTILSTPVDPFVIRVFTLDGNGDPGLLAGFNTAANASWTLVNANSITGFAANKFSIDLGGFSNFYDGSFAVATTGGNDLVLNYTAPTAPIPEPSTWALLALGGAALARIARRKNQAD